MSDINLLQKSTNSLQKQDYTALILRRISFILLFATAVISISLFVLVISSPLTKVKQQENALLAALDASKTKISRNVIIQERLRSVTKVLKERNTYEKNIGEVLKVLPQSVTITALEINKKNMQITGNSNSLDSLNTFINTLLSMQSKKEIIASVALRSFALQKEAGKYYFTMDVTFL